MSQIPPYPGTGGGYPQQPQPSSPYGQGCYYPPLLPHRGTAVLVLGICGLAICAICGIIAWVMGHKDLQAMREGRMDPSGRSLTEAGRICGMISCILALVGLCIYLVMFMVMIGSAV
jgi:hypothetical protein